MKSLRRNLDLSIGCFLILNTLGISLASAQTPAPRSASISPATTLQPVPVRRTVVVRRTEPRTLPAFDTIPILDPNPNRSFLESVVFVAAGGCPPQLVAGCSGLLNGGPRPLLLDRYDR
jgi:hypothetical protein